MKKTKKKALLIALIVSLTLLIVAVSATLLFDYYMEYIEFDTAGMIAGHVLGFLLMFFIVYRYEIKEVDEYSSEQNHNIY